jgi:putative colanic acid biosynthesis acetyltransferase WcaF
MNGQVKVAANRAARKWSRREQVGRVLWAFARPLFTFSPRPFWVWRRILLRLFGAKVGKNANVFPSVRITIPWNLTLSEECAVGDRAILYALGPISIGPRATVSQGAHLCAGTHDLSYADRPLVKTPITISADAWVAADAFIGPSVTIGAGAVVGARAVVMKDVEPSWIVAGNPARKIRRLEDV